MIPSGDWAPLPLLSEGPQPVLLILLKGQGDDFSSAGDERLRVPLSVQLPWRLLAAPSPSTECCRSFQIRMRALFCSPDLFFFP